MYEQRFRVIYAPSPKELEHKLNSLLGHNDSYEVIKMSSGPDGICVLMERRRS